MPSREHYAKRRYAALSEIRDRLSAHGESTFGQNGKLPSSGKQQDEFDTLVVESLAAALRLIDEEK